MLESNREPIYCPTYFDGRNITNGIKVERSKKSLCLTNACKFLHDVIAKKLNFKPNEFYILDITCDTTDCFIIHCIAYPPNSGMDYIEESFTILNMGNGVNVFNKLKGVMRNIKLDRFKSDLNSVDKIDMFNKWYYRFILK